MKKMIITLIILLLVGIVLYASRLYKTGPSNYELDVDDKLYEIETKFDALFLKHEKPWISLEEIKTLRNKCDVKERFVFDYYVTSGLNWYINRAESTVAFHKRTIKIMQARLKHTQKIKKGFMEISK